MNNHAVALIGCGYMGASHLDGLVRRPEVEIRWVVDRDPERATAFASKYRARHAAADPLPCLSDPLVDIVIIATNASSHLPLLRQCLAHGKHVLLEKPVAATLEDSRTLMRLVSESDCKVLVGHVLRHNATYRRVAGMIADGAIGFPMLMRFVQSKHAVGQWPRMKGLLGETSPLVDCAVHYIDVMRWMTGADIVSMNADGMVVGDDVPEGVYNFGRFTARFSDGSMGVYEAGWGNTFASEDLKEFVGPNGRIRITYARDRVVGGEAGDRIEWHRHPQGDCIAYDQPGERKPVWEQFQHLVRMIEADEPPLPPMADVAAAFEAAHEADRQIRERGRARG